MCPESTPSTVEEAIDQAAKNPLSVSIAGHTVTNRSIDDLVKAAQFQAASNGSAKKGFGLRFQKLVNRSGAWE